MRFERGGFGVHDKGGCSRVVNEGAEAHWSIILLKNVNQIDCALGVTRNRETDRIRRVRRYRESSATTACIAGIAVISEFVNAWLGRCARVRAAFSEARIA